MPEPLTYPDGLAEALGAAAWRSWQHDVVDAVIKSETTVEPNLDRAGRAALDALVAATGGSAHVVRFHADGYTLQHPITERLDGTLFDCRLDQLIQQLPAAPALGDFEVHAVDGQLVVGARHGAAEPT